MLTKEEIMKMKEEIMKLARELQWVNRLPGGTYPEYNELVLADVWLRGSDTPPVGLLILSRTTEMEPCDDSAPPEQYIWEVHNLPYGLLHFCDEDITRWMYIPHELLPIFEAIF